MDIFFSDDSLSASSEEAEKHVEVYLRIKAGVEISNLYTILGDTFSCHISDQNIQSNKNVSHTGENYKFTRIFKQESTQQQIFNATVKEKVLYFINGGNSTLMTYGSSGSGKTFTLIGTPDEPGIIPRAIKYLFSSLPTLDGYPHAKLLANGRIIFLNHYQKLEESLQCPSILKDLHGYKHHADAFSTMQERLSIEPVAIVDNTTPIIDIWVSLCEIYNEHIFDLLQPVTRGQSRPKLKIGGIQDNIYIKDLKHVYVRSGLDAYQLLQYGLENRNKASTAVNLHSSRSHCLFTIKLVKGYDCDNTRVSSFSFCDLAGSERLKKTLNIGDRLKESNCINNSLLVLGRCISMVRDSHNRKENIMPPFRESKLTQLFQRALKGKENIQLMVNINPSQDMFAETIHTLHFSAIAKEVVISQVHTDVQTNLDSDNYIQGNKDEQIEDLKIKLSELRKLNAEIEEENNKMRNQRADLVLQLSEEKLQTEEVIDEERNYLIESFKEIVSIKDKQIEELKISHNELLEITRQLQKESRIIVILSSDSNDDEDSDEDYDDVDDSEDYGEDNNDTGYDDDHHIHAGNGNNDKDDSNTTGYHLSSVDDDENLVFQCFCKMYLYDSEDYGEDNSDTEYDDDHNIHAGNSNNDKDDSNTTEYDLSSVDDDENLVFQCFCKMYL